MYECICNLNTIEIVSNFCVSYFSALLTFLGILDIYFISHAYYSTLIKGPSVQLVFGFEVS